MKARTCIITGAASGIGAALARRLGTGGWRVVGLDRAFDAAAPDEGFRRERIDLCDLGATAALAGRLATEAEAATAFVHCAGVMRDDDGVLGEADGLARLWSVHVASALLLARALAPRMPDRDGRIVFVGSRAAQGRAGRGAYAASKAALDGLARSLALELVTRGITVNVVAPGTTDTPMLRDPKRASAPIQALPIGRLIAPDEIAAAIAFLLGGDAGAITGQTLTICGGASLAGAPVRPPTDAPQAPRDTSRPPRSG